MQDLFTSVVRTVVPFIVGFILSFLASQGIEASPEFIANITGLLTFVFGALYYIVVRILAAKFPKLEWLLGSPKKPEYIAPKK